MDAPDRMGCVAPVIRRGPLACVYVLKLVFDRKRWEQLGKFILPLPQSCFRFFAPLLRLCDQYTARVRTATRFWAEATDMRSQKTVAELVRIILKVINHKLQ